MQAINPAHGAGATPVPAIFVPSRLHPVPDNSALREADKTVCAEVAPMEPISTVWLAQGWSKQLKLAINDVAVVLAEQLPRNRYILIRGMYVVEDRDGMEMECDGEGSRNIVIVGCAAYRTHRAAHPSFKPFPRVRFNGSVLTAVVALGPQGRCVVGKAQAMPVWTGHLWGQALGQRAFTNASFAARTGPLRERLLLKSETEWHMLDGGLGGVQPVCVQIWKDYFDEMDDDGGDYGDGDVVDDGWISDVGCRDGGTWRAAWRHDLKVGDDVLANAAFFAHAAERPQPADGDVLRRRRWRGRVIRIEGDPRTHTIRFESVAGNTTHLDDRNGHERTYDLGTATTSFCLGDGPHCRRIMSPAEEWLVADRGSAGPCSHSGRPCSGPACSCSCRRCLKAAARMAPQLLLGAEERERRGFRHFSGM